MTRPEATSPEQVVGRLLAVQAQDDRGFRLAVRSRSTGLRAADVDAALTERRSMVVTWLNRGTLHLVAAEDLWWLHALTTPQLATNSRRRLREEGVSPAEAERGVALVVDAVTAGPQTRTGLKAVLDDAGVPTAGQALTHVLVAANLAGEVVRGPIVEGEHAYVSPTGWLGPPPAPLDRDEALARFARRYLVGHGPAAPGDLARWAGIALGDARRGFAAVADEVEPFEAAASDGATVVLVDEGGSADGGSAAGGRAELPAPRLLGPFDPILHGWASREVFVGPHTGVVTNNGIFRPVALVDGRVVATWGLAGGVVTVRPLEPLADAARAALVTEAADVLRYLGLPDVPPVFE